MSFYFLPRKLLTHLQDSHKTGRKLMDMELGQIVPSTLYDLSMNIIAS